MYYVYELIDPRDLTVFYVGKGQGARMHCHERDAKRGMVGPKCDLIREIWRSGLTIGKQVIERFVSEVEAFAFERQRIASYGLDNLTNRIPGFIPAAERAKQSQWTLDLLKRSAPIMARAINSIVVKKVFCAGYDLTEAIVAFVEGAIEALGIEAVADAIAPFNVRIEGYGSPHR
jgi:hypothetical protein